MAKNAKDKNGNKYFIPAKEDSLEQLSEIGKAPYTEDTYPSDNTYDASAFLILSKALEILSEDEKSIIHDLYSKNKSAITIATEKGVSHAAINKRNKSILKKIKTFLKKRVSTLNSFRHLYERINSSSKNWRRKHGFN